MSTIWAFDLGKGSIGEAVWDEGEKRFKHVASLLIPAEFASTKDAASRRRMKRTRDAHKAREAWLEEVWTKAGLTPLHGRKVGKVEGKWQLISKGDEKLEREFPKEGDTTCYTSCLLRIKLLRGEKLEEWQIYKARESRRMVKKEEADEEKGTAERVAAFEKELHAMSPQEEYWFSCYFDAWKMGLWNPQSPVDLMERIDHSAGSTRNRILPRSIVESEIRLLVEAAGEQLPGLKGKASFVLYGPAGVAYASYHPSLRKEHGLREGAVTDWNGVLGQKIPRFDNRIIEKCVLIPRLNVCKAEVRMDKEGKPYPESLLASEVTCLMKLKNMRLQRIGGPLNALSPEELRIAFDLAASKGYKVTGPQWIKLCTQFGGVPVAPVVAVEEPKASGRSRFCRPALEVLKRLVLSGEAPNKFHDTEVASLNGNTDVRKGLIASDLKFLLDMGTTWQGIYIPNQKLDALAQRTGDSDTAILELIGSQNDPIVRHRLGKFWERLQVLEKDYGPPEEIAIEFIREDFMGTKALHDYREFIKRRADERKKARADATELGSTERSATMKLELLRQQGGECLYKGDKLCPTKLDEYEIDHIVPRSQGGPDAMVNYVLTLRTTNDEKANRTPFEWLSPTNGWNAYENRVKGKLTALRNKKVRLLLLPEAAELADKYTALAETAWIAKLSQTLAGLHFGWKNGVDDQGKKRVVVISGGLTARIRRKYKLNSLLVDDGVSEEDAEKNRDDDRHHALDAMVLAFIPGWARDESKQRWFRFPEGVDRETFRHSLANTLPHYVSLEKPKLAETIYGSRREDLGRVIVQRTELVKLAYKSINPSKTVYDHKYAEDQFKSVRDPRIKALLLNWWAKKESEVAWKTFCETFTVPRKDGTAGPLVRRVSVRVGEADEFADLSKDKTGSWRKAKKSHRGQIVYLLRSQTKAGKDKETVKVCPVYVFESATQVMKRLKAENGAAMTVYGFFQSGCMVSIEEAVPHEKAPLPAGIYMLNTIRTGGDVKLTRQDGKTYPDIPRYGLSALVKAKMRREE